MIEVYLNDQNIKYEDAEQYFWSANQWALEHCSSYQGYSVQDVSDVSYIYDNIGLYLFKDEKDVVLFTLRWKTSS
jgi:hypothetical protein